MKINDIKVITVNKKKSVRDISFFRESPNHRNALHDVDLYHFVAGIFPFYNHGRISSHILFSSGDIVSYESDPKTCMEELALKFGTTISLSRHAQGTRRKSSQPFSINAMHTFQTFNFILDESWHTLHRCYINMALANLLCCHGIKGTKDIEVRLKDAEFALEISETQFRHKLREGFSHHSRTINEMYFYHEMINRFKMRNMM